MLQSSTIPTSPNDNNNNDNLKSMWDPITQTYKDGIVPSHHTAFDIDELLGKELKNYVFIVL